MDITEVTLDINGRVFKLNYTLMENAIVAFFFEDRLRLGTLAIAMPGMREVAAGRSSVLLGGRYMMTTRTLAERLAAKSRRISLVSLFTELNEAEALRTYVKLLDKVAFDHETTERRIQTNPSVR